MSAKTHRQNTLGWVSHSSHTRIIEMIWNQCVSECFNNLFIVFVLCELVRNRMCLCSHFFFFQLGKDVIYLCWDMLCNHCHRAFCLPICLSCKASQHHMPSAYISLANLGHWGLDTFHETFHPRHPLKTWWNYLRRLLPVTFTVPCVGLVVLNRDL